MTIGKAVWRMILAAAMTPVLLAGPAQAEVSKVRTATQLGLTFTALMVMEYDKLVEKHAAALGLGQVETEWSRVADGGAINNALLAGSIDFAPGGVPAFLTMWDKTQGNANVRAIGSYNALTLSLLVRNPKIQSIKDFSETDRIAVPGVQSSSQALMLQMASEQAFGPGNERKLDPLTVSRGHPDAMAAFLSSASEITAHFSAPPFVQRELQDASVRVILTSRDLYKGNGTTGVVFATGAFCDKNPKVCAAYYAALGEAMDIIHKDPRHAAEAYLAAAKSKETLESVEALLRKPDGEFELAPKGLMMIASFMHKIGTIKRMPASWKDLVFPIAAELPGS